jgi:tetratricopeptide (TPR) repeat protein
MVKGCRVGLAILCLLATVSPGCLPEAMRYLDEGDRMLEKRDYRRAIAYYDSALREDPKLAYAYHGRGIARHFSGDLTEALGDFDRALKFSPDDVTIYRSKIDTWLDLLEYLSEREADTANAERGLARGQFIVNRILLMSDLDKLLQLDPADDWSYNQRGILRLATGDYDGAIADYTRAIDLNGEANWAYYNRGVAKSDAGDNDGAIEDLSMAITLDETDGWAYFRRGIARIRAGDSELGCTDLKRAKDLENPDAEGALEEMCR